MIPTPAQTFALKVDTREWDKAIAQYQAATKKAAEYVAWRAIKSQLFHLINLLAEGKAHNFRRKPSPWGDFDGNLAAGTPAACRLVASLLRGGSSQAIRRGVYKTRESVFRNHRHGHRTLIDQIEKTTRRKDKATGAYIERKRIISYYLKRGKYYSREYARAWAAAHTRFRAQHKGFIRILPRDLIDAVIRRMADLGMKPGAKPKRVRTPKMTAAANGFDLTQRGMGGVLRIAAQTWYTYKSAKTDAGVSTTESALSLEHALSALLPEARRRTIIDMNHYILKKSKQWDARWDEFLPPGT